MLALRAAAVTPPAVERAAPTAARASAPPAARQATPPAAAVPQPAPTATAQATAAPTPAAAAARASASSSRTPGPRAGRAGRAGRAATRAGAPGWNQCAPGWNQYTRRSAAAAVHRRSAEPRSRRRRPAGGASHVCRRQRAQHGHRPRCPGHGRHQADRCALGSGARRHPQAAISSTTQSTAPSSASRESRRSKTRTRRDSPRRRPPPNGRRRPGSLVRNLPPELREGRGDGAAAERFAATVEIRPGAVSTSAPTRSSSPTCRSSFPAIRDLLTSLDKAEPQVEIEARIITTTRDFAQAIGVQWGLNGRMTPEIGNTTNLAFPNSGTVGGRAGGQGARRSRWSTCRCRATSAIGIALGSVNGAFNLDVALSALERTGKGRVLSTPRVTTQNNIEAEIMQGVQIPLVTPADRQHAGDRHLQGRSADAPGDAADHRRENGHHADHGGERESRRGPRQQRSDRHATRDHTRPGHRWRDDGHGRRLHLARDVEPRTARRDSIASRCSAGCSSAIPRRTTAGNS